MIDRMFHFPAGPLDLAFERADPAFELGNRQAIESLAQQGGQWIVGPGPQDVVQVHAPQR